MTASDRKHQFIPGVSSRSRHLDWPASVKRQVREVERSLEAMLGE